MVTDKFPKNLSKLRKENKLSQKNAAAKLGVSQALLSHYEKGIREPGFDFLLRAAEFYDCSADYLLGRTNDKRGIAYIPEEYTQGAEDEYPLSEINRITAAVKTVSNILILTDNEPLLIQSLEYLKLSLYRLVRRLCADTENGIQQFRLSPKASASLTEALIALREHGIDSLNPDILSNLPTTVTTPENIEGLKALSAIISETEERAENLKKLGIIGD